MFLSLLDQKEAVCELLFICLNQLFHFLEEEKSFEQRVANLHTILILSDF